VQVFSVKTNQASNAVNTPSRFQRRNAFRERCAQPEQYTRQKGKPDTFPSLPRFSHLFRMPQVSSEFESPCYSRRLVLVRLWQCSSSADESTDRLAPYRSSTRKVFE